MTRNDSRGEIQNSRTGSRVTQWVTELQTDGSDIQRNLAENFTYYMDHVDAFETRELQYMDLPEFKRENKVLIHTAVLFGRAWGKESPVFVITGTEDEYITVFGNEKNAEQFVETAPGTSITPVTPTGGTLTETIEHMNAGESQIMQQLRDSLTYFVTETRGDTATETGDIIDGMPHFDTDVNWILATSALFGRLWELSDPSLWVVLDESTGSFYDVHGTAESAAEHELTIDTAYSKPVTPVDNDRQHADMHSIQQQLLNRES